jgi:multisubunit Na+/H+ antiporter MnhE subunit
VNPDLTLDVIRDKWIDILDDLERKDRVIWMAFFDARLAELNGGTLTLDFSDSRKFGTVHEFSEARARHTQALKEAIKDHLGVELEIVEM